MDRPTDTVNSLFKDVLIEPTWTQYNGHSVEKIICQNINFGRFSGLTSGEVIL